MTEEQLAGQFPIEVIDAIALVQLSVAYFNRAREILEHGSLTHLMKKYEDVTTKKDINGRRLTTKELNYRSKEFQKEIRASKIALDSHEKGAVRLLNSLEVTDEFKVALRARMDKLHELIQNN